MKLFNIIGKIIGHTNEKIAVIGISAGVFIAFVNVVARYVFDASFTWATELTIYLFLWSIFFTTAYCFRKDAHIGVTILLDIMPSRVAKIMLLLSHLITFIFLSAVAYFGYKYLLLVISLDERSIDLWNLPMWIIYLVIPISFLFSAYRVAEKIHRILSTDHKKILKESEAEQIIADMGIGAIENKENENIKNLNKMVEEIDKKTGKML